MIATADTTVSEACRLIAALPVPTERDRKIERLRSIEMLPAQDRRGFLWRSGERLEGNCSIFRNEDDSLDVLFSSDLGSDPLAAGSFAGRLAGLGFNAPAAWCPGADMHVLCSYNVPAGEPLERTVEAVLAALQAIGGGVPANGYELKRGEARRVPAYWQNA